MFQSIIDAVASRFAPAKQPAPEEFPPVAACAATPCHSPVVDEIEVPWTPENVVIPERIEATKADTIPDCDRRVPEHEIRMRAYLNWETAGKPKGREDGFWLDAMNQLQELTWKQRPPHGARG